MFGRKEKPPLESEDMRRVGRMEARMETLELKWSMQRDEMLKLVRRLEKREERAVQKERELAAEIADSANSILAPGVDEITERVNARRNRNAVHGP